MQQNRPDRQPVWIVAIAASAGGIEAIRTVLSGLPADFPAAVLIVQHLEPTRESHLAEILDRETALTVRQARAMERIAAGHVYVAPPDFHLIVTAAHRIELTHDPRVCYSRPSADVLFMAVAKHFGAHSIAVVLSGAGKDGADGSVEIHRAGGIVIAQDEATSSYFSMPGATIELAQPDFVLPLDQISKRLIELMASHGRN